MRTNQVSWKEEGEHTIARSVKALISLIARGARFLKETPCNYTHKKVELVFRPNAIWEKYDLEKNLRTRFAAIEVDFIKLILLFWSWFLGNA